MTLRMTDSPNVYRWAEKQREKQREEQELLEGIKTVEKQKEEYLEKGDHTAVYSCDLTLQILKDELIKKMMNDE